VAISPATWSLITFLWSALQTKEAYDKALVVLKAAGVILVPMDMHVLTELSARIMPDESFYTYEMPRELSRWGAGLYLQFPAILALSLTFLPPPCLFDAHVLTMQL